MPAEAQILGEEKRRQRTIVLRISSGVSAFVVPGDLTPRRINRVKFVATLVRQFGSAGVASRLHLLTDFALELSGKLAAHLPDFDPWVSHVSDASSFWDALLGLVEPSVFIGVASSDPVFSAAYSRLHRSLHELSPTPHELIRSQTIALLARLRLRRSLPILGEESQGRFIKIDADAVVRTINRWLDAVRSHPSTLLETQEKLFKNSWGVAAFAAEPPQKAKGELIKLECRSSRLQNLSASELRPLLGMRPTSAMISVWVSTPSAELAVYLMTMIAAIWDIPLSQFQLVSLGGYHPIVNAAAFLLAHDCGTRLFVGCDESLTTHVCLVQPPEAVR